MARARFSGAAVDHSSALVHPAWKVAAGSAERHAKGDGRLAGHNSQTRKRGRFKTVLCSRNWPRRGNKSNWKRASGAGRCRNCIGEDAAITASSRSSGHSESGPSVSSPTPFSFFSLVLFLTEGRDSTATVSH
ncbi:hypothetical protein MTO96_021106 [Rhipicephalus appendiculatus]